ncbi:MAG: hypothetical protein OZ929_13825 [Bryobacterales bacterium]|nr:hypothetical protein [Bryobacterales bacterium]
MKIGTVLYWAVPPLLCLLLFHRSLNGWFMQDDFAWLGLYSSVHSWEDLQRVLFTPYAQGTLRLWSERVFFLVFYALFGLNAFPYHLWVFLTQIANLILLTGITFRLTGSRAAGFLAPLFWITNAGIIVPMSWACAYNQILCAFFLLLAFRFWLKHINTGLWRYYWWQGAAFLMGFGALEINVVYPGIAAAYALLCARRYFVRTLPLFAASGAYTVFHTLVAPKDKSEIYAIVIDSNIFNTLLTYWNWGVGPYRLAGITEELPAWFAPAAAAVLTATLLGLVVWSALERRFLPAFFLSWFGIVILPVLPLRNHISDYYLALPSIGLAMLMAYGLVMAWRYGPRAIAVAFPVAVLYVASGVPVIDAQTRWYEERGQTVKNLLTGVARVRELHPHKLILLAGVTSELFRQGVYDRPFRLLNIDNVYLAPGTEKSITTYPEMAPLSNYVLPASIAMRALKRETAVVYEVHDGRLRNITKRYTYRALTEFAQEEPRQVAAGSELYSGQLLEGWYSIENGYRWMSQKASLRIGGPRQNSQRLYVTGECPEALLQAGPVGLSILVDSLPVYTGNVRKAGEFKIAATLPPASVGKDSLIITMEVSRTLSPPGESRRLGLVFGAFEIR